MNASVHLVKGTSFKTVCGIYTAVVLDQGGLYSVIVRDVNCPGCLKKNSK